ncbi:probable disease resistance protein At5g43730 [Cornus florida]|uniref:probable disease resistance protein At5g43730 n=1 Tax=Cornus florida TaxID=4283 RepID=UPI00289DBA43|nr:probable disease resistance protein At5g43730 [Cornus florida]XP_059651937.1 probable disease resistance protein At5g43730 [Cornus florida]XP_059651938.1 probable disease resistance protein At5g43730 [Cornus florida]XP_059651939.1 probable disease resistance protein At5g43730 [Cornus florida]
MDIFQTLYGVGKDICRPLAKCLCSVISLPDRFTELKNQLTTLSRRRADIEAKIEGVNRQKAPTIECKGWIEDVDKIEKEVKDIEDQHLINKRCLSGCFPDVIARARLGKNVEEMIIRVKDLQEKSKFEAGFVDDLPKAEMLPEKLKELNKQLTTLCRRKDDIKADIDRANGQKAPTNECKGWIADVGKIEEEVKKIEEEVKKIEEHDLVSEGCFPDAICEDVEKTIESVKELHEKSKFEAGFLADLPLAKVEKMPLENLSVEASTESTLQKILEHVRDGATQKIGIWGMGGIGKTTLMKLLNNRPEITNMFDVVIWVTVSNSWSIRKVQDGVAKRLSLDLKNESDDETVARRLLHELEGKKYLLLLDDVWEFLNLATVGIPSVNQNNGGKVVLTTRNFGVCREMQTDAEINVGALPKEEAWKMFESIVGGIAMSQTIQPIAKEIVQQCDGLPLALKVVGRALRNEESVSVWRNLLRKLKSPDKSYVKGMSDNVFTSLKASYDHLCSDDASMKNRFLYCGLYPEDHEIKKSKLIKYWRAEGLLSSECTLVEAGDEGRDLLRDLIDASLLEKCEDDNHVKMHDVIRDFALHLTSSKGGEKSRHVVRAGMSGQEMVLNDKEWEEADRISFINAEGYSLPEMPNCPKLLTLLLHCDFSIRYSPYLQAIPESFFNHMPTLRVLDMSGSTICSLPSSISNLVSLRALLLKSCRELKALPHEINALKKLEVLKITWHNMRDLPGEIWELTSLKCLKLKDTTINDAEIKVMIPIPSGKISKLSQLEHLKLQIMLLYWMKKVEELWQESFPSSRHGFLHLYSNLDP